MRNHATNPIEEQLKLWDIIVYDFLVGNTDNHIKNISLLYSPDLKNISLAPAYDIVSTVIYAGSSREMAISIGGEKKIDNIKPSHFADAASEAGLSRNIAMKRFEKLADNFEKAIENSCEIVLAEGYDSAKMIKEQILQNGGYGHL